MRKSKPQNGRRMDVKRELLQVVLFRPFNILPIKST